LDGEDSRTLAAVGAFRVVPSALGRPRALEHLRDEALSDGGPGRRRTRADLTQEGRDLLDSPLDGRREEASQAFTRASATTRIDRLESLRHLSPRRPGGTSRLSS
jgi:hypothetical protein